MALCSLEGDVYLFYIGLSQSFFKATGSARAFWLWEDNSLVMPGRRGTEQPSKHDSLQVTGTKCHGQVYLNRWA